MFMYHKHDQSAERPAFLRMKVNYGEHDTICKEPQWKEVYFSLDSGDWGDGSLGKGSCQKGWQNKFNPWDPNTA